MPKIRKSGDKPFPPTTGRGVGGAKPKPASKPFKLFYPEQERANAKAVGALQGIGKNVQTALDMFRPKKK